MVNFLCDRLLLDCYILNHCPLKASFFCFHSYLPGLREISFHSFLRANKMLTSSGYRFVCILKMETWASVLLLVMTENVTKKSVGSFPCVSEAESLVRVYDYLFGSHVVPQHHWACCNSSPGMKTSLSFPLLSLPLGPAVRDLVGLKSNTEAVDGLRCRQRGKWKKKRKVMELSESKGEAERKRREKRKRKIEMGEEFMWKTGVLGVSPMT